MTRADYIAELEKLAERIKYDIIFNTGISDREWREAIEKVDKEVNKLKQQ